MKKLTNDPRTIYKLCKLYYQQSYTQEQIAKSTGISRPTVSRILANGIKTGIVKIEIQNPEPRRYLDLEHMLETRFSLREAVVIEGQSDQTAQHRELGQAAAGLLSRIVRDEDVIGVSLGRTVKSIAPYIEQIGASPTFVALNGGVQNIALNASANQLVVELAQKTGGNFVLIPAPGYIENADVREALNKEAYINDILNTVNNLNIALVGIGALSPKSTIISWESYSREEFERLQSMRYAGDICLNFFDMEGNTVPFAEYNQRVFGIDIENLRNIPYSIGMVMSVEKVKAILGAIRGGYINVLITDCDTAQQLLRDTERSD